MLQRSRSHPCVSYSTAYCQWVKQKESRSRSLSQFPHTLGIDSWETIKISFSGVIIQVWTKTVTIWGPLRRALQYARFHLWIDLLQMMITCAIVNLLYIVPIFTQNRLFMVFVSHKPSIHITGLSNGTLKSKIPVWKYKQTLRVLQTTATFEISARACAVLIHLPLTVLCAYSMETRIQLPTSV